MLGNVRALEAGRGCASIPAVTGHTSAVQMWWGVLTALSTSRSFAPLSAALPASAESHCETRARIIGIPRGSYSGYSVMMMATLRSSRSL
eukprot:4613424-Alexandrium_andersonii.AAC.1